MSQKVIRAEPRSDLELWVMGYNWCQLQIDHITRQREVHRGLIEALMGDADVVETEDGRRYDRRIHRPVMAGSGETGLGEDRLF